jgi:hypothetical protein
MLLTLCWQSWHLQHMHRRRAAPPASRASQAGRAQTIDEGARLGAQQGSALASAPPGGEGEGCQSRPTPGLFSRSPRADDSSARSSELYYSESAPSASRSLTTGRTTREAWQLVEELKAALRE